MNDDEEVLVVRRAFMATAPSAVQRVVGVFASLDASYMRAISGDGVYVLPSVKIASVPLAEATLNHLFKRLDFGVPEFSPHGTRGTAATLLREHGFSRDVVELLLAHTERSQTAASYHHHELEAERRKALQYLADEIDRQAAISAAGNVVSLKGRAA